MISFYGSVEPSELATLASVRSRHMQSSIKRIGNSAGVVIPAAFLKQMNLTVGGAIELTIEEGAVVMRPLVKQPRGEKISLDWLLADYAPCEEQLLAGRVGNEGL